MLAHQAIQMLADRSGFGRGICQHDRLIEPRASA
jgi:hypothetical protein